MSDTELRLESELRIAKNDARRWQNEARHLESRAVLAEGKFGVLFDLLQCGKLKMTKLLMEEDKQRWMRAVRGEEL
jgi:hypothetical protein